MPTPTVFSDEVRAKLLEGARDGLTIGLCADLSGIGRQTLYDWLGSDDPAQQQFAVEFRQARAEAARTALLAVKAGGDGYKGPAWFLERGFPEDFQRRERLEHTGEGGGPVAVTITLKWPDERG